MKEIVFEELLQEALQNIKDDRDRAITCLVELQDDIKKDKAQHKEVAISQAKYLEVCQRSNEQLVKIADLARKKQIKEEDISLSDNERDALFEDIADNG